MTTRWLAAAMATAGVLAVALGTPGCVGSARPTAHDASAIGGDEVVVVGVVELDPPLDKGEQKLKTIGSGQFRNKVILIIDDRWRAIRGEPRFSDYRGRIEAIFGEPFYVKIPSRPFYLLGGMVLMKSARGTDPAYLPGGLKVDLGAGDKAVYIGTIRYHRNEYFDITKITVRDDYERASAQFRQRFGGTQPLRKRLVQRVAG